jgi:hypothetical protein
LTTALACSPEQGPPPGEIDHPGDGAGDSDTGDAGEGDNRRAEGRVWGWVSALEMNDVCDSGWYLLATSGDQVWFGGVRAYFAASPTYHRSLQHDLGFMHEVRTTGDCTLYDGQLVDVGDGPMTVDFSCTPDHWCEMHPDTQCVQRSMNEAPVCEPLPEHWRAGSIAVDGMNADVSMAPDSYDRYLFPPDDLPEDLFDAGDTLTATVEGDEVRGFSVSSSGVAHLETSGRVAWSFPDGRQTEVTWTPGDGNARIHVAILGGSHDPNPLATAILCDAPDSAGKVAIPAELMTDFNRLSYGFMSKCSRITRYTRKDISNDDLEFHFYVGSARNLQLISE